MREASHNPWVHRWAVITVLTALLPVTMGALTTTLDAGMAFNDWPTSDGHNMLTYPWFRSAGDKFVEHGHRLAGMLIGVVAIALLVVTWKKESRRWVRIASAGVLAGVIAQGLLGGVRVRMDERTLAMIHGQLAAWVVSLMALFACWTSQRWQQAGPADRPERVSGAIPFVCLLPIVIVVQYTLGGFLRHQHTAMDEHLMFAFVVTVFAMIAVVALLRTGVRWLRASAGQILLLILVQMGLGAGAWITRFGFAPTGFVATARSLEQTWMRTSHTVVGMLLFASSIVAVARVLRVSSLSPDPIRKIGSSTVLSGGAS